LDSKPDFMTLFLEHEWRLRALARALVFTSHDADELFQETSVTMLKKFDSKESDIDFANWACRIMLFKVKELNRARSRDKLRFSDDAIDLLASETPVMDRLEGKGLALERCLKQLNQASLSILLSRYRDGFDIPEIAEKTGRTIQAIYRSLSRSRQQLHECIIRTLSTSDGLY